VLRDDKLRIVSLILTYYTLILEFTTPIVETVGLGKGGPPHFASPTALQLVPLHPASNLAKQVLSDYVVKAEGVTHSWTGSVV
jgi:hypothetical protein